MSVSKKKITLKVYFLLILMFSIVCTQFVNECVRIYELAAYNTEQYLDITLEDSCSLETHIYSAEEAEDCITCSLFKSETNGYVIRAKAIAITSHIHEVYLGLNTPPPEQMRLLS